MRLHPFFTPGLAIYSYLVFDEEAKKGALIDPTIRVEAYLDFAAKEGIEICHILETHVHADFCSGAAELKAALRGKPLIHCSAMGGSVWLPAYADQQVYDRTQIQLGKVRLEARHTPGHTEEHLIWLLYDEKRQTSIPELAFTGDLLFVGSVGRPDLAGADKQELLMQELYNTLFERLAVLPDHLEIFPSHGAGSLCGKQIDDKNESTWGYEKLCNPHLKKQEYAAWRACLLEHMPAAPDYFFRLKQSNLLAPPQKKEEPLPQMKSGEEIRQLEGPVCFLDVRSPETFAAAHLPGSLNVPFSSPEFPLWAGMLLPPGEKIFLILDRVQDLYPVIKILQLIGIGIDQFTYCLFSSLDGKETFSSAPILEIPSLQEKKENFYILDVRTPLEWQTGYLANAHFIELALLPQTLKKLPHNMPIAVFCRSGNRASLAASYLRRCGFRDVAMVRGGIKAWQRAGLPLQTD